MELEMNELNGNEKYYYLDESLPVNPYSPNTIGKGDIMLFGSSCLVIFYDNFNTSYSYTRIGKINYLKLARTLVSQVEILRLKIIKN